MPQTNYVNPETIRPKYDELAPGLAGMYGYQDRKRYEDAASLQDMMMQDAARLSREDVTLGGPARAAGRQGLISEAGLKGASLEEALMKNQRMQALLPGEIGVEKGKQSLQRTDQRMQEMQQGLSIAQAVAQVGAQPGPDLPARLQSLVKSMGVDPQHPVLREILNTTNPAEIGQRAQAVYQVLNQASSQFREKMAEGELRNKGTANVANISGYWSVEAAKQRASARAQNLMMQFQSAKTTEQMQFVGQMILMDEEIPEAVKNMVKAGVEQARRSEAEKRAQGQVQIPGANFGSPAPDISRRLQPGGQETNTGIPGVTRLPQ